MNDARAMTGAGRPRQAGCLYLFQGFGIPVFVHWSWGLLLALVVARDPMGQGLAWGLAAVVGVFAIVTLHEFGHALAARSVGGRADRIVLNVLGGVAYVQPPARPWPTLWSIAAGPLVNVALIPVLWGVAFVMGALPSVASDGTVMMGGMGPVQLLVFWLAVTNVLLLAFNLLPVYPLDGGQMVQSVLWMLIGRAKSLRVSAIFGLIVSLGLAAVMLATGAVYGRPMLFLIALFIAWSSFRSLMVANLLAQLERVQGRHVEPWELRGGAARSGAGPGGMGGGEVIEGEVVDRR
ncbi:MAG: M50 family metallopeptidase [Planctomycetota bacterium]